MKIKVQNSKHDAATLIQERLQAQKKLVKTLKTMPEPRSLLPKFPVLGPHQCAKPCGRVETISKEEQSQHNMLALPLLLNWKRFVYNTRHLVDECLTIPHFLKSFTQP